MGQRSGEAEAVAGSRAHRLYLLTDHEAVPFEQDGWRDGEPLRAGMAREFSGRLNETGGCWLMLSGSVDER